MVVAHAQVHHVADGYGIAMRGFDHHRAFFNSAHGQYGHLRLANDGCAHEAAERAYIGEGKGAAGGIVGL